MELVAYRTAFVARVAALLREHVAFRAAKRVGGVAMLPVQSDRTHGQRAWMGVERVGRFAGRCNLIGGSTLDGGGTGSRKRSPDPTPEDVAGTLFDETCEELCIALTDAVAFVAAVRSVVEIPYFHTVSLVLVVDVTPTDAHRWQAEMTDRIASGVAPRFRELTDIRLVTIPRKDRSSTTLPLMTPYAYNALVDRTLGLPPVRNAFRMDTCPIVRVRGVDGKCDIKKEGP